MADIMSQAPGIRVLSLDGGDVRCFSQIELLQEYMHRLEIDFAPSRPCHHFHSIVAVGTASLIAVLIGVLGLSVDETAEAFIRVCKDVFPTEDITPEARSQKLEVAIERLLKARGIPENAKLNGDVTFGGGCKVALGYMSAAGIGRWRSLRNYESRQSSYNPTIVQALRVAMAVPGVFTPVFIGSELMQEKLISAVPAFINPTLEAIKEVKESYSPDRKISIILSLGSGKGALSNDIHSSNTVTQQAETSADDFQRRWGNLLIYFRLSVDRGLEHAIPSNSHGYGLIKTHTASYLSYAANEATLDSCLRASQVASNSTPKHLVGQATQHGASVGAGLPPLSPFFISRDEPMSRIVSGILGHETGLRIIVLSGLGGSGKTQLAIHFAKENIGRFQSIFFIDGSSQDSIKNGLLVQLGLCDPQFKGKDISDITSALSNPGPYLTTDWLIILDNVDASETKVLEFIPNCNHGAFLITTRRQFIDGLAPGDHVHLGVMSPKEAVDALVASALNPEEELPERHREVALEIVTQLGMLPVAIIQAGCYINKQQCLHDYLDRLRDNRQRILQYHTVQRDRLRYNHGVYAAFDTTMDVLSARALRFLGILSFFHYTDIPRRLFNIAASFDFKYERYDLLERNQEVAESATVLRNVLCPSGEWDESDLDELLEEMQSYSIVSLVSLPSTVVLRFHPLFHSWANDRLATEERGVFKAAAIRLLACGTHHNNYDIWDQLQPHIQRWTVGRDFEEVHVSDRLSFIDVLHIEGRQTWSVRQCEVIYDQVKAAHGKGDESVRSSRALLQLARVCGSAGDVQREEKLTRQVVAIRKRVCGQEDLETMHAVLHLACVLQKNATPSRLTEAKQLLRDVLRVRRTHLGPQHYTICEALVVLGQTHNYSMEYKLAEPVLEEAVDMFTDLLGRRHVKTITAMRALAYCYSRQGKPAADALHQEILEARQSSVGDRHLTTLYALSSVAEATFAKRRFVEAEAEWRRIYNGVRDILGPRHRDSLYALHFLALSVYQQQRYDEAEALLREEVEARKATMPKHQLTIQAQGCLKYCIKVARAQRPRRGSILTRFSNLFSS